MNDDLLTNLQIGVCLISWVRWGSCVNADIVLLLTCKEKWNLSAEADKLGRAKAGAMPKAKAGCRH